MKNNENDKIKRMYESINTPEYDVKKDVLDKIKKRHTIHRINRKVLIAAVLCVLFLMAGTAVASGMMNDFKVFRYPDPNAPIGSAEPIETPLPTPVPETSEIDMTENDDVNFIISQYTLKTELGEYRMAYYFEDSGYGLGGGGYAVSPVETDDFDVMANYISNANIAMPIPQYIPAGYEFSNGKIEFYLDDRMYEIEPRSKWTDEGITYLIYDLYEGYEKNIYYYNFKFENEEGDYLRARVDISCHSPGDGLHEFGASDTATAEYVDVKNYGEALLIHEVEKTYNYLYRLVMHKEVEPVETIEFFWEVYEDAEGYGEKDWDYTITLNEMMIMIDADDLPKEEVLKFAKNLK